MVTLQINDEPDVLRRVARVLRNLSQWDAAARARARWQRGPPAASSHCFDTSSDLECAGQGDRQRSAAEAIFGQVAGGPSSLGRSAQTLRKRGFNAAAAGLSGILAQAGLPSLSGFLAYLKDLRAAGLPIHDDAASANVFRGQRRADFYPPSFQSVGESWTAGLFARLLLAPEGERHRSSQAVQNLVRRLRRQGYNDIARSAERIAGAGDPSTYLPDAKKSTLMYRNPEQLALIWPPLRGTPGEQGTHLDSPLRGEHGGRGDDARDRAL